MNNRYDYNRFSILKANSNIYFCELDLPNSDLEKRITSKTQTEDREIQLQKELFKAGIYRAELYEILAFIHKDKKGKQVSSKEADFMRTIHSYGFNRSLISELFHRTIYTISSHVDKTLEKYQYIHGRGL